ncbi:MAG: PLP-dependent transferase, partial [Sphingobacteriales bacterium]|nr:PLP-dependent transferase [Sphingobacteriales bacterium]
LFTIVVKAERMEQIVFFCENLQHIVMAVSWGGHESLAMPKCAGMRPEHFRPSNEVHRMVRIYVGLEEAEYLIKDLEQAFEKMG